MLAGFRRIHTYARTTSWREHDGRTLFGAKVTILGGGGIAELLARLLAPFGTETTVVRNRIDPMPDVARVVNRSNLVDALSRADQVVLALALTPETTHIVDAAALVAALVERRIGGAALDVTDPEPLPDGHPLWTAPSVIITRHTANPRSINGGTDVERIQDNVRRFAAEEELVGRVNVELGY
jgi:D-3-phosphoglycerate dehydrogenase